MNKIIYLSTEGIQSTVFQSQVKGIVEGFTQKGVSCELVLAQSMLSKYRVDNLFKTLFDKSIKLIPTLRLGSFFFGDFLVKNRIIKSFHGVSGKKILICRNPEAIRIGIKTKKSLVDLELIYDVRSAIEEEKRKEGNFKREDYFRRINTIAFNSEDIKYNFISSELKNYYEKLYSINFGERFLICPSVVDISKFKFIESRCVEGKAKLLYIGGTQDYQNIDKIVKLSQYYEVHLVLSKKLTYAIPPEVSVSIGLEPTEISDLASNYDYGVLWRDNEVFNLVATPTKISEYWALGLKVIAVNNAGGYSDLISSDKRLGGVYDESFIPSDLVKVTLSESRFVRNYVEYNFTIENNVDKYLKFLKC